MLRWAEQAARFAKKEQIRQESVGKPRGNGPCVTPLRELLRVLFNH
jgi:hypothetical protein